MQSLSGQPLSISTFTMEGESRQLPFSDTITISITKEFWEDYHSSSKPSQGTPMSIPADIKDTLMWFVVCGDEIFLQLEWWREGHRNQLKTSLTLSLHMTQYRNQNHYLFPSSISDSVINVSLFPCRLSLLSSMARGPLNDQLCVLFLTHLTPILAFISTIMASLSLQEITLPTLSAQCFTCAYTCVCTHAHTCMPVCAHVHALRLWCSCYCAQPQGSTAGWYKA